MRVAQTEKTQRPRRRRRIWTIVGIVVMILAPYGIGVGQSVLVRPPLVIGQDAVTDAASATVAHVGNVPVVIGGHSLGGAMAADYASRHADKLAGSPQARRS
jgi:hypothetical protein